MKSVPNPHIPINALHADVRRLLKKYKCELQLHQVRAQFMGAIASPIDQVNPMQELKSLWNGTLPAMKNMTAVSELMQVFAMGLWNHLSVHCDPDHPFELSAFSGIYSHKEIAHFAEVKGQEIESFISGFFQRQDNLRIPTEISHSIDVLEDLIAMFKGIVNIPENHGDTEAVMRNLMEKLTQISQIAQQEINAIIVKTAQDRLHMGTPPTTLH